MANWIGNMIGKGGIIHKTLSEGLEDMTGKDMKTWFPNAQPWWKQTSLASGSVLIAGLNDPNHFSPNRRNAPLFLIAASSNIPPAWRWWLVNSVADVSVGCQFGFPQQFEIWTQKTGTNSPQNWLNWTFTAAKLSQPLGPWVDVKLGSELAPPGEKEHVDLADKRQAASTRHVVPSQRKAMPQGLLGQWGFLSPKLNKLKIQYPMNKLTYDRNKNQSSTPKSSILVGFSLTNKLLLGYPHLWKLPFVKLKRQHARWLFRARFCVSTATNTAAALGQGSGHLQLGLKRNGYCSGVIMSNHVSSWIDT